MVLGHLSRSLRYGSRFYVHFSNACQSRDETGLRTLTSIDIPCNGRNCQNVAEMDFGVDHTDTAFAMNTCVLNQMLLHLEILLSRKLLGKVVGREAVALHPWGWHWWGIWTPTWANLPWDRPELRRAARP